MHPWHDISPGKRIPNYVDAVIEIPSQSRAKYELDKDSGLLRLDRVLYSAMFYPANYGFIPQTYCDDGDPLDILVLSQVIMHPRSLVSARVIGVMRMMDGGEMDDKIIAVAENDMSVAHIHEVEELPDHFFLELRNFFEEYKKLENKTVIVQDFQSRTLAVEIVAQSLADYAKNRDRWV